MIRNIDKPKCRPLFIIWPKTIKLFCFSLLTIYQYSTIDMDCFFSPCYQADFCILQYKNPYAVFYAGASWTFPGFLQSHMQTIIFLKSLKTPVFRPFIDFQQTNMVSPYLIADTHVLMDLY